MIKETGYYGDVTWELLQEIWRMKLQIRREKEKLTQ